MRLITLGGLSLEGSDFKRPQPLLLLAYLAIEGKQEKEHLCELFWRDATDPRNSLSTTLGRLRKQIPNDIYAVEEKVWTTIQADTFELTNSLKKENYTKVLELYTGEFLNGIQTSKLGEELENWIYLQRELFGKKARKSQLELALHKHNIGEDKEAAILAENAYDLKEALEPEVEQLKQIYFHFKKVNHLRVQNLLEHALDYGIDFERNSVSEKYIRAELPNNIVKAKTCFVGRGDEQGKILEYLFSQNHRLITIHGPGGIGKSRLANSVAFEAFSSGKFSDGVFEIGLDSISSGELIPNEIAYNLNINLHSNSDCLQQTIDFIDDKSIIIILDNYEHVLDYATLPTKLLELCPNLKIVTTSRERLLLEEEWVVSLEGLSYPIEEEYEVVSAQNYSAIDLFVQRASQVDPSFELSLENIKYVIEICSFVEGSPLGIELASAWLDVIQPQDIVEEIHRNLNILSSNQLNKIERHQSMRAVFEHSWNLMSAQEQEALMQLSIFVGGFNRKTAEAIYDINLIDIQKLQHKSIVSVLDTGRFFIHGLVRKFSLEKLTGDLILYTRTKHDYLNYYQDYVANWNNRSNNIDSVNLFSSDEDNILNAWQFAVDLIHKPFLEYSGKLMLYYERTGQFEKGISVLEKPLKNIAANTDELRSVIAPSAVQCAWLYFRIGKNTKAEHMTLENLKYIQENTKTLLTALSNLGVVAAQKGLYKESKSYFENAVEIAQSTGLKKSIAISLNNLSEVQRIVGEYDEAYTNYVRVRNYQLELENKFGEIIATTNIANLYIHMCNYSQAHRLLVECLRLAKQENYLYGIPLIYSFLSEVAIELDNIEDGENYALKALSYIDNPNNQIVLSRSHLCLGRIYCYRKQFSNAKNHFNKVLSIAWSEKRIPEILECLIFYLDVPNVLQADADQLLNRICNHPSAEFRTVKRSSDKLGGTAISSNQDCNIINLSEYIDTTVLSVLSNPSIC